MPDFEHEDASPELGEMTEARLVDAFADDDGFADGALLAKDADGEHNDVVMTTRNRARARRARVTPTRRATARRGGRNDGSKLSEKAPVHKAPGLLFWSSHLKIWAAPCHRKKFPAKMFENSSIWV